MIFNHDTFPAIDFIPVNVFRLSINFAAASLTEVILFKVNNHPDIPRQLSLFIFLQAEQVTLLQSLVTCTCSFKRKQSVRLPLS